MACGSNGSAGFRAIGSTTTVEIIADSVSISEAPLPDDAVVDDCEEVADAEACSAVASAPVVTQRSS